MQRRYVSTVLGLIGALAFECLAGSPLASTAPAPGPIATPTSLNVRDLGAVGDGRTKDTASIQRAIDRAGQNGGGTVTFPPGKYLCGTLILKSKVHLHLELGATLLGSPDIADYPNIPRRYRAYSDNYGYQSLIQGEDLHDIAITGLGTIDGQGSAFRTTTDFDKRPFVLRLTSCKHVTIEGITLRNSAMWMQHYLNCEHVRIRGISVYNHCNYNNDMIDIECCRDVLISDCFGDSDDDAITLKSSGEGPCENITITNCILSSHCNAIKMGTCSYGGFKNIAISNCVISPCRTEKVYSGYISGLAGIALEIVDGGTLDGVTVSNIAITGTQAPIFLRLGDRGRVFLKDMPRPAVGKLRNVIISNVVATQVAGIGCSITGLPGHPVENVTLSNIRIMAAGGGTKEHVTRTIPELPEVYPESTMFGMLPAYGFYCRHVDGLTFENVVVRTSAPDARPALVCEDVSDLVGGVNTRGN